MPSDIFEFFDESFQEPVKNERLTSTNLTPETVHDLLTEFRQQTLTKDINSNDDGEGACRMVNDGFTQYLKSKNLEAFSVLTHTMTNRRGFEGEESTHIMSVVKCGDMYYACDGTGEQLTLPGAEKIMVFPLTQDKKHVLAVLKEIFGCKWQIN